MSLIFAIISFSVVSLLLGINNVRTKVDKQQALMNIAIGMSSMICFYALNGILKTIF